MSRRLRPTPASSLVGLLAVALPLLAAVVGVVVPGPWSGVAAAAHGDEPATRVLVLSLPGLTWQEVQDHPELVNLRGLLDDAAVAALAPRGVSANSLPGDAYLTMGAGSRSVGEPFTDGLVLAPDEPYLGEAAGGVFERRTGTALDDTHAAALEWPKLLRLNDDEPFDSEPGLLAATLAEAGITAAVVANADGSDTAAVSYERQAAYAFIRPDGTLPLGALDTSLLVASSSSAFGVRLDPAEVTLAFESLWTQERAAVLVEASDLARVMRYRPYVEADRYRVLRADALADSDALAGRLLGSVDLERDAVVVLAPYHDATANGLTVVGVAGPGIHPGYLRSASTQRSGILTLVDLAPTVLDLLGVDRPTGMEGRPAEALASAATLEGRIERLVATGEASLFRENLLTPTTLALVLALLGVVAALLVGIAGGRSRGRRWREAVAFASLMVLGGFPASYVARAFPLEDLGLAFYWPFLVAFSLLLAIAATVVGRRTRSPWAALAVVLGVMTLVLVGDVLTGSHLHLSAAFGYSPTGNSRLYGISNYSFGQLSVASCLLAAFLAWRRPGRRGAVAALAFLVGVLVVLGVPAWGSDVGGIIAFAPTVLVFGALLANVRVRPRHLLLLVLASVLAVTVFGFIDLARPAGERAHLGRLFERVGDEGVGPLVSIVQRKLAANLRVSTRSFWVAAIPVALAAWVFLRHWPGQHLGRLHREIPTLHAALLAATVAAVLGSVVNDSGAIVGGVAATVLAASLAYLASTLAARPDPASSPEPAP